MRDRKRIDTSFSPGDFSTRIKLKISELLDIDVVIKKKDFEQQFDSNLENNELNDLSNVKKRAVKKKRNY
jgi:hypothetical protein